MSNAWYTHDEMKRLLDYSSKILKVPEDAKRTFLSKKNKKVWVVVARGRFARFATPPPGLL